MYRIQSSSKRHLINLAYLGVKLKKTLATKLHKFMCHKIQTEDKKVFHSSKVNIQFFYATLMFYIQFLLLLAWQILRYVNCLWTFVFVPTPRKSGAAKFTARKELEWGCV